MFESLIQGSKGVGRVVEVIAGIIVTVIMTIIGALIKREFDRHDAEFRRQDKTVQLLTERISYLELHSITRTEFRETFGEAKLTMTKNHEENKEFLRSIDSKIDRNEERDANTRHDIREHVHALVTRNALLGQQMTSLDKHIISLEEQVRNIQRPKGDTK